MTEGLGRSQLREVTCDLLEMTGFMRPEMHGWAKRVALPQKDELIAAAVAGDCQCPRGEGRPLATALSLLEDVVGSSGEALPIGSISYWVLLPIVVSSDKFATILAKHCGPVCRWQRNTELLLGSKNELFGEIERQLRALTFGVKGGPLAGRPVD